MACLSRAMQARAVYEDAREERKFPHEVVFDPQASAIAARAGRQATVLSKLIRILAQHLRATHTLESGYTSLGTAVRLMSIDALPIATPICV